MPVWFGQIYVFLIIGKSCFCFLLVFCYRLFTHGRVYFQKIITLWIKTASKQPDFLRYVLCSSSPLHTTVALAQPCYPPFCIPPRSHVVFTADGFLALIDWPAVVFAADQQAFQHAVRQRDLLGLSCLLSHGFGLSPALIEGLVESCGPRCVHDCFMEAVACARYGTRTYFFFSY